MAVVHLQQLLATLRVSLDEQVLSQHIPSSPMIVGEELANQVHGYVKLHKLGYYPALEYFQTQGGVDADLLEAAESIAWILTKLIREEVQRKLRPVFSSVRFQAVQTQAFIMPPVRYGSANAVYDLARHYAPNSVKLDLLLSIIRRQQVKEGMEAFVRRALQHWLVDSFESVAVSSVVSLDAG